jgi:hypothetical protein
VLLGLWEALIGYEVVRYAERARASVPPVWPLTEPGLATPERS